MENGFRRVAAEKLMTSLLNDLLKRDVQTDLGPRPSLTPGARRAKTSSQAQPVSLKAGRPRPNICGCIISGTQTSGAEPTSTPKNPGVATPITRNG